MRARFKVAAGLLAGGGLVAGLVAAAPASAAEDPLASTIQQAAPDALKTIVPMPVLTRDDVSLRIPADAGEGIAAGLSGGDEINIGLPFADQASERFTTPSGLTDFDNNNGSITVPAIHNDGSVQILTVINQASAPTRYDYSLDVPDGSTVRLDGGLAVISDARDEFIAGIAPAWAKDANGVEVPTHYELNGHTLTQVVEHTPDTTFPVVADPWLGKNLFSSIRTSTEKGQPRFLLARSAWGLSVSSGLAQGGGAAGIAAGQQIMLRAGWSEATSRNSALKSKASLRQQYDCHVFYAFAKPSSWNLEKHRANKSNWASNPLSHLCNW